MDPPDVSRRLRDQAHYSFLFLAEDTLAAIRQWDLVHPHAGPDGADIARPAEFLLDSNGKVLWRDLTDDFFVRVRPEEVLRAADAANGR